MIDPNDFNALVNALRDHPQCCALIVWQRDDCEEIGVDPDLVRWKDVEGFGIEAGWQVLEHTKEWV